MAQNIYDDPSFFAGYGRLRRSLYGLAGAPEWPSLRALLPPLQGLRVVDFGCGFGWFSRWAAEQGAQRVLGIDLSERMLERARRDTSEACIEYVRADLETVELQEQFDLAYSSLAFHYVEDLARLFAVVHRSLVPGGRLVFSTEHPIFTAPAQPGFVVDAQGRRSWPLDGYQKEGPRTTPWIVPGVVKYHRTLGTLLKVLIAAGFNIRHLEEWGPTAAQLAEQPELAEERERPMMLIVAATRD